MHYTISKEVFVYKFFEIIFFFFLKSARELSKIYSRVKRVQIFYPIFFYLFLVIG